MAVFFFKNDHEIVDYPNNRWTSFCKRNMFILVLRRRWSVCRSLKIKQLSLSASKTDVEYKSVKFWVTPFQKKQDCPLFSAPISVWFATFIFKFRWPGYKRGPTTSEIFDSSLRRLSNQNPSRRILYSMVSSTRFSLVFVVLLLVSESFSLCGKLVYISRKKKNLD